MFLSDGPIPYTEDLTPPRACSANTAPWLNAMAVAGHASRASASRVNRWASRRVRWVCRAHHDPLLREPSPAGRSRRSTSRTHIVANAVSWASSFPTRATTSPSCSPFAVENDPVVISANAADIRARRSGTRDPGPAPGAAHPAPEAAEPGEAGPEAAVEPVAGVRSGSTYDDTTGHPPGNEHTRQHQVCQRNRM